MGFAPRLAGSGGGQDRGKGRSWWLSDRWFGQTELGEGAGTRTRKTVMASHPVVLGKPRWPGGDLLAEPSQGRAETSRRPLPWAPFFRVGGVGVGTASCGGLEGVSRSETAPPEAAGGLEATAPPHRACCCGRRAGPPLPVTSWPWNCCLFRGP